MAEWVGCPRPKNDGASTAGHARGGGGSSASTAREDEPLPPTRGNERAVRCPIPPDRECRWCGIAARWMPGFEGKVGAWRDESDECLSQGAGGKSSSLVPTVQIATESFVRPGHSAADISRATGESSRVPSPDSWWHHVGAKKANHAGIIAGVLAFGSNRGRKRRVSSSVTARAPWIPCPKG